MENKNIKKEAAVESEKITRKLEGTVVSAKMDKTIVVEVESVKLHPKYHKRYKVSRKYKVHDENNQHKIGDIVKFVQCRPLSKEKRWRVLNGK